MCICASVHNHRQVRNVPQDVSRTMQHLQLFQEDCPYERDLRVSVLTCCWVHVCRVTCYLNCWPRMCLVHSRSCVKMLAMCKACPTLPPCSSCTPSPSCAHALTRTRTGCDVTHVTRHTSHVARHISRSYSDTPFDAFVAFSNVIVRPFFQNYFKRREVCPV